MESLPQLQRPTELPPTLPLSLVCATFFPCLYHSHQHINRLLLEVPTFKNDIDTSWPHVVPYRKSVLAIIFHVPHLPVKFKHSNQTLIAPIPTSHPRTTCVKINNNSHPSKVNSLLRLILTWLLAASDTFDHTVLAKISSLAFQKHQTAWGYFLHSGLNAGSHHGSLAQPWVPDFVLTILSSSKLWSPLSPIYASSTGHPIGHHHLADMGCIKNVFQLLISPTSKFLDFILNSHSLTTP